MTIRTLIIATITLFAVPIAGNAVPANESFAYVRPVECGEDGIEKYNQTTHAICANAFRRDLKIMSSLGAKQVKLTLAPQSLGVAFSTNGSGVTIDQNALANTAASLPVIINQIAENGMSVVVDFLMNDL